MNTKRRIFSAVFVSLLLSTSYSFAESSGLGGLLGGSDSGALITLGSGEAGSGGLINVGLGGGGGNVVDLGVGSNGSSGGSVIGANVNVGGSGGLVDVGANVGSGINAGATVGGSNGLVDVQANVGSGINAGINIGGSGGLVDVGIGIGGGGGNSGGNGGTRGKGGNGGSVIIGNNGGNGSSVFGRGGGGGGMSAPQTAACTGLGGQQLMQIFSSTSMRGWDKASNIQLVPIKVCADLRKQMSNYLAGNFDYQKLVNSVAGDPLINAALGRTKYQPGHVLGVQRNGNQLTVYVF